MNQAMFNAIASHFRAAQEKPNVPGAFEIANGVYAIPCESGGGRVNLWYQGRDFQIVQLDTSRCIASEITGPNKRVLPITKEDYETALAVFGYQNERQSTRL